MENMSRAPSQGGGLGKAFVGPGGIWSLEGGTNRLGQAEQVIGTEPQQLLLPFRAGARSPPQGLKHWSQHGFVQGESSRLG